jgi:hypothetical protein
MRRSTRDASPQPPAPFVPPYPPSWFNRLEAWIDRRPGPFWLPYAVAGLVLLTLEFVTQRSASGPPAWNPISTYMALTIPVVLGLIHGLDRLAQRSFDSFRLVLRANDLEASLLRYQVLTLPRRGATWAVLGATAFGAIVFSSPIGPGSGAGFSPASLFQRMGLATTPASVVLNGVLMVLVWSVVVGTLVYHTVRQLLWLSRIYSRHTHIDLLRPGPLYHLTRITAATAIFLVAIVYLVLAADRLYFPDPRNILGAAFFGLLAVLAFVGPLVGIHRLLVTEKERLLDESADRLKLALAELHRRVEQLDLREMDALNKAIASLEIERNILGRIPTWPWQPETLRTFIVALLLPLALWMAQALLGRVLGP